MEDTAILSRLDTIASILKLAHKDELDQVREEIRQEPGKAAILDATPDWTAAGPLVKNVAKKVKKSERSIRSYVAALLELGVLENRGSGPSSEYKSTGII